MTHAPETDAIINQPARFVLSTDQEKLLNGFAPFLTDFFKRHNWLFKPFYPKRNIRVNKQSTAQAEAKEQQRTSQCPYNIIYTVFQKEPRHYRL